jgi:CRISPR-associated protein Cas5t
LPQEVKDASVCPFPVVWRAVVSIFDPSDGIDAKSIKETLSRKDLARFLNLGELAWRTDAASPLGLEARPIVEAFCSEPGVELQATM